MNNQLYYVCCVHGFVRGIKFIRGPTLPAVFECTTDVRTAKPFVSVAEANTFMLDQCKYQGHFAILTSGDHHVAD